MVVTMIVPAATWSLQPVAAPGNPSSHAFADLKHGSTLASSPDDDIPPFDSQPILATELSDSGPAIEVAESIVPAGTPAEILPTTTDNARFDPSWSERATTLLRPWLAWIVAGWCVGVVLFSLRPLLGWSTLRRLRRVGVTPVSDDVSAALRRVSERLGLRRAVRVLHSTVARVPIVVGYFRPVILLPVSLATSIPAAQLEAILAHELAHVRRHDFLVNLLQTLVETVFFYHPAVWWLSGRLRAERENCCDDLVVAALGNRVEYGRALLAIEELRGHVSVLAVGAADGSLLARVRRIVGLRSNDADNAPWSALSLVVCGIVAVCVMSVLGWNSPADADPPPAAKPLVANLPDGLSVELVGITKNTAPAKDGWRPDGRRLGEVAGWDHEKRTAIEKLPNGAIHKTNGAPSPEAFDLLFKIDGLKTPPSLTLQPFAGASTWRDVPLADPSHIRFSILPDKPAAAEIFRLGITAEPWGEWQRIGPDGKLLNAIDPSAPHWANYQEFKVKIRTKSIPVSATDPEESANASRDEAAWGKTTSGLRARVVPVLSSMSEDAIDPSQRVTKFDTAEEVAFAVELENVSDQAIKLLDTQYGDGYGESKGMANSNWYGQFLFSIDLCDGDGKKIKRPEVEVVDLNTVLDGALLASLEPGKAHRFLLRPAKWLSAMTQRIEPGRYRAVVRYHGLPERVATRIKEYRPDSPLFEAVAGDVVSKPAPFELASFNGEPKASANGADNEPQTELVWGEPTNGLRAATSFAPPKATYSHGEKPETKLHVQNVSDKPITLASLLWLSELPATVVDVKGELVQVGSASYTGWTLAARVTLKPEETVVFDAGNVGLAITKQRAGTFEDITHRTLVAPAGKYRMQLQGRFGDSFFLKDGKGKLLAPLEGDWIGELRAGAAPLTIANETIDCNIFDSVTLELVSGATVNFRFIKPKSGDAAEEIVADIFWGPRAPGRISFTIPDKVMRRADREEIEVEWGVGGHADYEAYAPAERIPLRQFFHEGTKAVRETLGAVKLTPKRQTGSRTIREPAFRLTGHSNIQCLGYDDNSTELVVVSTYHVATVRRWDMVGKKLMSEAMLSSDKHLRPFREGTFKLSGDRRRVIAATDEFVGIWDTSTGELLKKLPFATKEGIYDCWIDKLDCTPDLSVIAGNWAMPGRLTLAYDAHVMVWDGASGNVLQTVIDKNATELKSIDLSRDGKRLATTNGGGAKIWETSTGGLLRSFPNDNSGRKHSDPDVSNQYTSHVWSVQLSPDGNQLAIGDILGVRLWDAQSGDLFHQLDAPYRYSNGNATLVFSKDGRLLARTGTSAAKEKLVPIWATRTGEKLFELHTESDAGAFSDDNKQFAVGLSDRQMALAVFQLSGSVADAVQPPPESTKDKMRPGSHHRGKKAEELIDNWKPVWGEPRLGIQYGVALTTGQRQFRVGERVPLAVFFRNVSDKPRQLDHHPDFFWNMPEVVNADGETVAFEKVALLGTAPHYRDKLEPGEALGPFYVNFGLGETPRPGRQNWAPYWKTPVAGQYKLTHTLSFKVASPAASRDDTSDDWKAGQLTSGTLAFEIVEGGQPDANDQEAIRDVQAGNEDASKIDPNGEISGQLVDDRLDVDIAMQRVRVAQLKLRIAEAENRTRPVSMPDEALRALKREMLVRWGTPVNGVQIGLERVSIRDTYTAGEAVEFRRRVRNTGAEVLETTLRFRPGANAKSKLFSDGRFTVHFGGPTEDSVRIKLPPGADQPIAASEFRIETKNLRPGRYFVEAYDRFQIGDPQDAKRQVASSPGWTQIPSDVPLDFDVVAANGPVEPAESKPFVLKGGPDIAWGAPVQGLQAGVRYTRVKNVMSGNRTDEKREGVRFSGLLKPTDFSHPDNWQWKIGDIIEADIVVRNLLPVTSPLTFAVTKDEQLVELDPYVHTVQVYEMGGALMRRRVKSGVAWSDGHEPTDRERTVKLRPGDMAVVARTAFQLLKEPDNRADIAKLPRVDAILVKDAAKYSFRTRMLVRGSVAATLYLATGQTRLWVREANAPPDEPATVATRGRGRVTLTYDMPGGAPQADIMVRGSGYSRLPVQVELQNGGEPRPIELAAGRYEFFRRVTLTVGSWTMDVRCNRQIVTVTAGKNVEVKFARPRQGLSVAKGQWSDLATQGVAGAFLTVHPIAEKILDTGDPDSNFDFEIDRETLLATTCRPDGKFALEPLPVGRYAIVLRAFREPAANGGGHSLPYLVGVNTFTVLSENRGVYFYPNDFRVRPRWNTPTWSPTRVANGDAAEQPANGAAANDPAPVDATVNTIGSGLVPGQFGGFLQTMRIDPDGSISYGDGKGLCQMTLFDDDRLKVVFHNDREIWTDVTLPLVTGAGGQRRAAWSTEIDGYVYQATAIPVATRGCLFRLEKRRDGRLIHGSLQFFAVKNTRGNGERDAPTAPIDYREWRVDLSGTGVVVGRYTGASRPMRIAADGTVSYSDRPHGICHLAVLEDDRLTATFRDARGMPTEVTLPLVTTAAQHRASWSAEIDGHTLRATSIPYSDTVYIFRLEKVRDGKLIEGEEQVYAINQ